MRKKYNNIVVAIDGSKESEIAFKRAVNVALQNESKLYLLNVIDKRSYVGLEAYDSSFSDRAKAITLELLEEYKQRAVESNVQNVEIVIEFGSPKEQIPRKIAPNLGADLIICGATGLNSVEKFIIGSVSENIVRHAKCDVLMVRDEA